MANKDRNKRAARKARQAERAELEEQHRVSGYSPAHAAEASKSKLFGKKDNAEATTTTQAKPVKREAVKSTKKRGKVAQYFADVKTEMHQVTWPSRPELRNYSVAVIVMLLVFGVVEWAVDNGFVALIVAFTGMRG